MPSANVGDIEIYFEEHGQGEPVLLAPPSWWPSDTWHVGVVPFLSRSYRTIVFDCRGTGYSSKPDHGYSVEQFAQDCVELLQYLKISRAHSVGFALGGQIVQAIAIARPELVGTLTIAAAGAGVKTTSGVQRETRNSDDDEIAAHGFERFIRGHLENSHMAFERKFYEQHPEVVQALSDALWKRQTSPEQHRHHYEARRTWDTLGNAPRVTVPTLILSGASDDINRAGSTPVETARRLAELIPNSELALVPNVKHMIFWDGEGALHALENFLQRHPLA